MTLSSSRSVYLSTLLSMTLLVGCNNISPITVPTATAPTATGHTSATINKTVSPVANISPAVAVVIGDYVSAGYANKAQGYDWVAVLITANGSEQINIKVRARSDIKKPTCTFDGQATLMGQDKAHGVIFQTVANDSKVFLQFKDDKLTIDSEDKYALNYYCSGGGSIVGEYQKLAGKIELN